MIRGEIMRKIITKRVYTIFPFTSMQNVNKMAQKCTPEVT